MTTVAGRKRVCASSSRKMAITFRNLLTVLALITTSGLMAQDVEITGKVTDTAAHIYPPNVVISFLKEADSTLVGFTRSKKEGVFSQKIPQGNYIVLVTSIDYADFVFGLRTDERKTINLLEIPLTSRERLLEEIIISQQAIRIKGDTTEFLADSFKVKENATVEDLLKVLPGIQVDRDGKITAQGQVVQKILVDGDEFFSDDPTIASKNLRADAVRKVQVFDKKSEQAEFTGIDDGERTKTINLELKEDAKNGYFGKLSAGGLDKYYNFQAMINAFKAKRKLSAFLVGSSTEQTGLDWNVAGNYGFNPANVQYDMAMGGVTMSSSSSGDLGSGNFSGAGLPESIKGGLHFSNKWNEDKVSLSSNYLYNNLKLRNKTHSFSENILENSSYFNNTENDSRSDRQRNDLTAIFDVKLDSTSSIKVDAKGSAGHSDYLNEYRAANTMASGALINESDRHMHTKNDQANERVNIFYRKRLKRPGQTFSLSLSQSFQNSRSHEMLYDESRFYHPLTSALTGSDTTDQRKLRTEVSGVLSASGSFMQPLSAVSYLMFDYTFTNSNHTNDQLTFDQNASGKYESMVDSLSSKYRFRYRIHEGGLGYRFTNEKINFSAGGSISQTAFHQHDFFEDTSSTRDYVNLYPRADFSYKFSSFSNLRLNYNGYTSQPTIFQIQPVIDNRDPLNITIGNPALRQSFTNSFDAMFTDVKVMTERYLFAGVRGTVTNREINESYYLDSLGRRISQYVNTDGNYMINLFAILNMKIPKSAVRVGMGPIVALYRYTNYVNHRESVTNTAMYRARLTMQINVPGKFDANFAAMPGYNVSKSNLNKSADRNYWASNISLDASYQLPWKMEIGSDIYIDLREKITAFDRNNNVYAWNAYIEKRMLKNESLALRASIFDILEQNKGFNRYQLATGLYEQRYLTWGQYGLIRLTYNFVKKGSKGPDNMGGGLRF